MKTRLIIILIAFFFVAESVFAQGRGFDRPRQGDLRREVGVGPGRRTFSDVRRDDWASQRRVARRNDRTDQPRQSTEPWWEKEAEANANISNGSRQTARNDRGDLIRSSQIIAMVGNEPILAGDLLGQVNERLQPVIGQFPEEEIDKQRWMMLEQLLPSTIEVKIVYLDFTRSMKPEQIAAIRENIYKQFDDKQLPELIKNAKVNNVTELEQKLRSVGSSSEKIRRGFFEQVAAREMIRRNGDDPVISPAELLAYYRKNLHEYAIPAEAQWEQLMVNAPSFEDREAKAVAWTKLSRMGNAVVGGAPLHVVAKRDSDGPNAEDGGRHDWTAKGSLVSDVLDEAIFNLPTGRLSDIMVDDQGFHIVRVIQRKGGGYVPFTEAQKEIRETIQKQRRESQAKEYIQRLKEETYVWSYFGSTVAKTDKRSTY